MQRKSSVTSKPCWLTVMLWLFQLPSVPLLGLPAGLIDPIIVYLL